MREKYCWLVGDWKMVLERYKRKTLDWRLLELLNRVIFWMETLSPWRSGSRRSCCASSLMEFAGLYVKKVAYQ